MSTFDALPRHVSTNVLVRLAPCDLTNLARTSKSWHAIVTAGSGVPMLKARVEHRGDLIEAASRGFTDVVQRLLIDRGARLLQACTSVVSLPASAQDRSDGALVQASKHGHADIVRLLLDAMKRPHPMAGGSDRDERNAALVEASARGHTEVVRLLLLDRGGDKVDNTHTNSTGADHVTVHRALPNDKKTATTFYTLGKGILAATFAMALFCCRLLLSWCERVLRRLLPFMV